MYCRTQYLLKPLLLYIVFALGMLFCATPAYAQSESDALTTSISNKTVQNANETDTVAVYWIVNKKSSENLYTTAWPEVNKLCNVKKTWTNKGVLWYAPKSGKRVYRLVNKSTSDHHFTLDTKEVRQLTQVKKTWKMDFNGEPVFYSGGDKPIWRLRSDKRIRDKKAGTHRFAISESSVASLKKSGWTSEGKALYAVSYTKPVAVTQQFTIKYHLDNSAAATSKTTKVTYGKNTATLTVASLGFSKTGYYFGGWRAYREYDKKWAAKNAAGAISWQTLTKGKLPNGYTFALYGNGTKVAKSAPSGVVHFYGQWISNAFTVKYHLDDSAAAHTTTTQVPYGKTTTTRTHNQLGFTKQGKRFLGWRAYREVDKKWWVKNASGVESWQALVGGKLPNGYSYSMFVDGASVAKTAVSGNVHFYGQWVDPVINVTNSSYGANPADAGDDYKSIQRALDVGKNNAEAITVVVPKGTYRLSRGLVIYSNTTLQLDPAAEMIRSDQVQPMLTGAFDNKTGGYGQARDITVTGGIWNGNVKDKKIGTTAALITIRHAQNIELSNCAVRSFCSRHMVNFSGVKNVVVDNVVFSDQIEYTGSDISDYYSEKTTTPSGWSKDLSMMHMEALHFDCISKDGKSEPSGYPHDGTANQNVVVKGCTFQNLFCGVGSHYNAGNMPTGNGITIQDNTFTNVKYTAIHICSYTNAKVLNNKATKTNELVRLNKSTGTIDNNSLDNASAAPVSCGDAELYGIALYENTHDTIVSDNTINTVVAKKAGDGIYLRDTKNIKVQNNTVANTTRHGMSCTNATNTTFDGNKVRGATKIVVSVQGGSGTKVINNTIDGTSAAGVDVLAAYNMAQVVSISGNTVTGAMNHGIAISDGANVQQINDNIVTNPYKNGIMLLACSGLEQKRISVSGNQITGSQTENGIYLEGSSYVDISENTVNGSLAKDGVLIRTNSESVYVRGNTCTGNARKDLNLVDNEGCSGYYWDNTYDVKGGGNVDWIAHSPN